MSLHSPRSQAGITVLGFLILATLFGVVGLAVIKLTPMFLQNMRLGTILKDMEKEFDGGEVNPGSIRTELNKRFSIEDITLPNDEVKITQSRNGYTLRIQHENRAPYAGGVYLVLLFDKQVEIKK